MKYSIRPGIVKTEICGIYLLVPNRAVSMEIPSVKPLSLLGSFVWSFVSIDRPMDGLIDFYSAFGRKTKEEAQEKIQSLLDELADEGYLIREEDET